MAPTAEATWPAILAKTRRDLMPFPGRFALAWRMALLCAIVTATAMLYRIPEAAISCYLVIFLMRADASETIAQAVALLLLVTVIVPVMIPVINATADSAFLRILIMAAVTFATLFFASATTLGEQAAIIGLVIAFVLSLVSGVPAGIVATFGLESAWQMVAMPMALMIAFLLVLGRRPHDIVADAVAGRLDAAANALGDGGTREIDERIAEGNDGLFKRVTMARLLHLAPVARTTWLLGAVETSYRLLLATAALPPGAASRDGLAAACRTAHADVRAGRVPDAPQRSGMPEAPVEADAWDALAGLAGADGGATPKPAKPAFLTADAFTNPDHQRYALKTTLAAMTCYLIYTGISWQGIQTAMVTCYVTALGTTGETVHKLALRIAGCLVGAALGVGSIAFVIPHLSSVGGLMVLVFACVLVGAWVAAGPERVAYAGVQVGLAFLLTVLGGFGPSTDMSGGGDRIAGILLGNVIMYFVFTGIWPRSAAAAARVALGDALAALGRAAAAPPEARRGATSDIATAAVALGKAREVLFMLPFEPRRSRPPRDEAVRLARLVDAANALVPAIATSRETLDEAAAALTTSAATVRAGAPAGERPPAAGTSAQATGVAGPVARITSLVAG